MPRKLRPASVKINPGIATEASNIRILSMFGT
jgi:hypothetical protein